MKTIISYFFCTVLFSFFMFTAQAQVTYKASKEYGSTSGKNFVLPYGKVKSQLSNINKIRTIAIHFDYGVGGRGIEQISVGWIKKDGGKISQKTSQKKGPVKYIYLDSDEYITKVTGQDHPVLTRITFYTNKGKRYGPFGKKLARNHSPFQIIVPLGFEVIGFSGKADQKRIKSIGLIYRVDEFTINPRKDEHYHMIEQQQQARQDAIDRDAEIRKINDAEFARRAEMQKEAARQKALKEGRELESRKRNAAEFARRAEMQKQAAKYRKDQQRKKRGFDRRPKSQKQTAKDKSNKQRNEEVFARRAEMQKQAAKYKKDQQRKERGFDRRPKTLRNSPRN